MQIKYAVHTLRTTDEIWNDGRRETEKEIDTESEVERGEVVVGIVASSKRRACGFAIYLSVRAVLESCQG